MSNLEPGCLARIINSTNGTQGASVGKIVQCLNIIGQHSLYGTIWEVSSKDTLVSEYGGVGNKVHVPAKWLKKIEPGELDKKTEKKLELTH